MILKERRPAETGLLMNTAKVYFAISDIIYIQNSTPFSFFQLIPSLNELINGVNHA